MQRLATKLEVTKGLIGVLEVAEPGSQLIPLNGKDIKETSTRPISGDRSKSLYVCLEVDVASLMTLLPVELERQSASLLNAIRFHRQFPEDHLIGNIFERRRLRRYFGRYW
jgi:hypothetical protein